MVICPTFGMSLENRLQRGKKTLEAIIYLDQLAKRFTTRGK
jgi:hypothetical protein